VGVIMVLMYAVGQDSRPTSSLTTVILSGGCPQQDAAAIAFIEAKKRRSMVGYA